MYTFLDNFQQIDKHSAQISSHKADFRREKLLIKIDIFILFENWLSEFKPFRASYRKSKFCTLKMRSLWRILPNKEMIQKTA